MTLSQDGGAAETAAVVLGSRVLAAAGQGDMVWGHLAVRDPEGRGVWMKAPGWGLEEVRPDRVVLVGWNGRSLAGPDQVHKEYPIHTELMRARPDVNVTVHTHAAAVNAFAALNRPLLPVSHDAVVFAEHGLPRYAATAGLVSTPALGRALAETLGPARACLMPQHGLAAVGQDVAHAVMTALFLERACRIQLTAQAAGEIRCWTGPEESVRKSAECWPAGQMWAGWRYWTRRVGHAATR
ncbi:MULTISPECIES: class II aldolase/adducin family protein [unclassified Streptomyces]|uniref:class II aldolase/adducin family protein n=1 Tax=unclassified Streptomyces TaxID=2593676 RepID=UPI000363337B|nr:MULTISPECIES: class II aldolase/adducin family protein [unclassified Streptomyces]MYT32178.1 class II aldolase/adducin family protein [Streptomyces sp. SID8354]